MNVHSASIQGNLARVDYWLQMGRSVDEQDEHGFTPLHWASRKGHDDIVTRLVQMRANANARNCASDIPLHYSASEVRACCTLHTMHTMHTLHLAHHAHPAHPAHPAHTHPTPCTTPYPSFLPSPLSNIFFWAQPNNSPTPTFFLFLTIYTGTLADHSDVV